jgi:hypothetical protein
MAPASVAKAMDRPGAYADGGERLHRELREGESDQSEEAACRQAQAAREIGKVPAPAREDEKVWIEICTVDRVQSSLPWGAFLVEVQAGDSGRDKRNRQPLFFLAWSWSVW